MTTDFDACALSLVFARGFVKPEHYREILEQMRKVVTKQPSLGSLSLAFPNCTSTPTWHRPQHAPQWLMPNLRSLDIQMSNPFYFPDVKAPNLASLSLEHDEVALVELTAREWMCPSLEELCLFGHHSSRTRKDKHSLIADIKKFGKSLRDRVETDVPTCATSPHCCLFWMTTSVARFSSALVRGRCAN